VECDGDESHRQVRNIAEVTTAVARGRLSRKITVDVKRNPRAEEHITRWSNQLNAFASEVSAWRAKSERGEKLGGQAQVQGVAGTWKD